MVEFIADESAELAHIVEDLLTASRFDLEALAVDVAPTEIDELVRSTVASLTVKGDRALEQHLEPAVASADRHRLRQVVRNLLTIAYRYGGYSVRVTVRATSDGATIENDDDGEGIGDADPETIFQPYRSVHSQSASQPGSVGLGLTISRQLIRMMGGELTYHHADGWTTFRVHLPRATESSVDRSATERGHHGASREKFAVASHDSPPASPG
jgi:signal transduction histidine kinase